MAKDIRPKLVFRVNPEQHRVLKAIALIEDSTLEALLTQVVDKYLEEYVATHENDLIKAIVRNK